MSRYGRSRCASSYSSHGSASSVGTLCAERLAAADIYEPVRRRFPLTLLRSHFLRTARVPSVVHRLTDRSFASPSILVLFRSSLSLHTNSPPPSAWGLHPGGFSVCQPLGAHYPSLLRPVVVVVPHLPALGLVLPASFASAAAVVPNPSPCALSRRPDAWLHWYRHHARLCQSRRVRAARVFRPRPPFFHCATSTTGPVAPCPSRSRARVPHGPAPLAAAPTGYSGHFRPDRPHATLSAALYVRFGPSFRSFFLPLIIVPR
jgi:hypothetical protein